MLLPRHYRICFAVLCAAVIAPLSAQNTARPVWTTSVQTGMADTFQLTLGGMFGNGPAWHNRVTTGVTNVFHAGDSLSIYGADTMDTGSRRVDWQAGIGYRRPVLRKRGHTLTVGSGLQRWLFPSVKTGSNDWLVPGSLAYDKKLSTHFNLLATSDSWTLLKSSLPTGSLLHTQGWLQTRVLKRESVQVSFRHGPAHTRSWGFYGTRGDRVLRYQTMLTITHGAFTIEGGYRKQWGLQRGIPDNRFWQFSVTRTFARALSRPGR